MTESQQLATEIVRILKRAGHVAYFAGGWVRDFVMDHPSSDIDIATGAKPQEILDLFPQTILVGIAFGVVIVMKEGHQFEVATFREDLEYLHGRRPEKITFTDARADAQRRDFTINGMFYDPIEEEIHDFVHGRQDIEKGVIRAIGDADERFVEDRLRMIRAIRFAARFEFTIDFETERAIKENADTLLPAVAMERVWDEFKKMAAHPHLDIALVQLHRQGLLPVIFPSLAGVHLNDIKHRVSPFAHYPKNCPPILYLMALFPSASSQEIDDICRDLRISKKMTRLALLYRETLSLAARGGSPIDWAYLYAEEHGELCLQVIAARFPRGQWIAFLKMHHQMREVLYPHIKRIQERTPLVSAALLKGEGIPQGPLMGQLLKEGERLSILHDLGTPQQAFERLKNSSLWPSE